MQLPLQDLILIDVSPSLLTTISDTLSLGLIGSYSEPAK